jgi:two-component system, chemotaxis family, sensor kinase CheA
MADRAQALRERLLATFRIEAGEHLRAIGIELDAIAAEPAATDALERLERLFRAMHTLKGAARSVGIAAFEEAAHRCEALVSAAIARREPPEPALLRALQDAADLLAGYLGGTATDEQLAHAGVVTADAAPVVAPPAAVPEAPHEAIRVDTERLDRLVALAENLLGPKLAAAEHAARALELVEAVRDLRERRAPPEELRTLEARARALAVTLRGDARTLRTTVDDLYDELLRVRLTPASTMLEGFPRMVRDLCRITGKDVTWQSTGGHLEIDRKVLALVKDPLVHMVRNAIDHGIESPEARAAAGKPRRGHVSVTVAPVEGGRISIEVADDGRGFALDALRDAAVRAHHASAADVAGLSDAEVAELAFSAGVSTTRVVTTISGHGRGLAIVREAIERIEGRVTTRSSPGVGTVIRLELPASIVTYRALLVAAEGERFLLPVEAIERGFLFEPGPVDAALPHAHLRDVLGLPRRAAEDVDADERSEIPALLVRSGERRGILLVDEVLGEHEVVVKDLRPPLRRVRNVLAAGLLGTGDLVLVLRPLDVLHGLRAPTRRDVEPVAAAPRVVRLLVVDDSITTRTMEMGLFEAAGYAVRGAADGVDAWELLQAEEIDIVVSDVDMPRMDGFALCAHIRAHRELSALPIVLVTAREAQEDEERGLRAGANAYVLKSGFDQSTLLEIVRRFA